MTVNVRQPAVHEQIAQKKVIYHLPEALEGGMKSIVLEVHFQWLRMHRT